MIKNLKIINYYRIDIVRLTSTIVLLLVFMNGEGTFHCVVEHLPKSKSSFPSGMSTHLMSYPIKFFFGFTKKNSKRRYDQRNFFRT